MSEKNYTDIIISSFH